MQRGWELGRFAIALMLALLPGGSSLAQNNDLVEPKERRHSLGPLTPRDYQAELPEPSRRRGRQAGITTEIKYDFQYQTVKQRDKLIGELTGIEVFAVVLRDKSWKTDPRDKALLDHEQGRFDLAQIEALRGQIDLIRRFRDDPLEVTGKKEVEVRQTLDREIRKLLRPYVDAADTAHAEYERVTGVGTLPEEQAAARREQRDTFKKLAAAAAKLGGIKP